MIRDLGTMKILNEKDKPLSYIVVMIGDKTYSTKFSDLGGENIQISKEQETETVGIGRQGNHWIKGTLTETQNHKILEEPIPFQINIYTKSQLNIGGNTKMAKLSEEAQAYEPPKTKNIADLEVVRTDLEIIEKEFTRSDGETFSMRVVTVDGEDYRVPVSVLKSLKAILEEKPGLKCFKVKRSGEGMKTEYTLIPLD